MGANGDRRASLARSAAKRVIDEEHDISDSAFAYLAARTVSVGGGVEEARLFRTISFSGERAYELAVPAGYGDALARALMAAGRPFGVAPYGLEGRWASCASKRAMSQAAS